MPFIGVKSRVNGIVFVAEFVGIIWVAFQGNGRLALLPRFQRHNANIFPKTLYTKVLSSKGNSSVDCSFFKQKDWMASMVIIRVLGFLYRIICTKLVCWARHHFQRVQLICLKYTFHPALNSEHKLVR